MIAFDTGPGNMVMDAVAPPFDRDGERARAGQVNAALLDRLACRSYYRREPPKSCGREQYGAEFVRETGIDIATATELTARTIALAIERYPGYPRGDRFGRRRAQSILDGAAARACYGRASPLRRNSELAWIPRKPSSSRCSRTRRSTRARAICHPPRERANR